MDLSLLHFLCLGPFSRIGLCSDTPALSIFISATVLKIVTISMLKHFASRQACEALKTRKELDVSKVHETPMGSPMLVYHLEKDMWERPYYLSDNIGEEMKILTFEGPAKFCSTVVKQYHNDDMKTSNRNSSDAQVENRPDDTSTQTRNTNTTVFEGSSRYKQPFKFF